MPHLAIQHSKNISTERMQGLCEQLHSVLCETKLYPLGGLRVRALVCQAAAIADLHPDNAFVDMVFRIAAGRSSDNKKMSGAKIMACAESYFIEDLARPHFALSLEIIEISSEFSWKQNSIHQRLKDK